MHTLFNTSLFLKFLHLLYDPGGPKLPLSTICNFLHKNAPNQIYDETHAKAVYAFQIFPAQKLAVNLRLLANTLLSLVGGEGEASFGCEVSQSHPFKNCLLFMASYIFRADLVKTRS